MRPAQRWAKPGVACSQSLRAVTLARRPGVTGWAQVRYRYGSSLEDAMEKLRYDLYYIKHLSVFFDLTIVFDTVKVVLFRKGAA